MLLDFEDVLGDDESPYYTDEDEDNLLEVIEIDESGVPIGIHNLLLEDLPSISDYFELEPLGAFTIRGRVSGSTSTGVRASGSTSTSGSTRTRTSSGGSMFGVTNPLVSRAASAARRVSRTSRTRTGTPAQFDVLRPRGIRLSSAGAKRAVAPKTKAKIPVKKLAVTKSSLPKIVATPKLEMAGSLCGCSQMPRILELLEKADMQRTATNEHNVINNTMAFRRAALRKLASIESRAGRRSRNRESIILAACGMR